MLRFLFCIRVFGWFVMCWASFVVLGISDGRDRVMVLFLDIGVVVGERFKY